MSKKLKQGLVPELRFPEFRDSGEWQISPLKKLATSCTEKNHDGNIVRVLTNSAEHGIVDQRDYFDKDIAVQGNLEGYFIVKKGDFVYNPRISSMAPVGPISKNNIATGVMSPLYTVFRFNFENDDYYAHFFKTTVWHHYMRQVSSTGARHDRMAISKSDFIAMPIPTPPVQEEQQKIADCLSSLDELITAHTQKHQALKSYKKGLLQNLFPAEGETVPALRFPEFRDFGEWEETTLGKCLLKKPEYGLNAAAVPFSQNLPTYIRITDISDDGRIREDQKVSVAMKVTDEDYLEDGDIVLARTGASVGKSYKYNPIDGRLVFAGFLIRVRPNRKKLNSEFLFQLLFTDSYWKWVNINSVRGGQPGINGNQYASLPITLPLDIQEQRKIADFLSSADDLISSQVQKIEELKAHKQGLMQQLFPSVDEVGA